MRRRIVNVCIRNERSRTDARVRKKVNRFHIDDALPMRGQAWFGAKATRVIWASQGHHRVKTECDDVIACHRFWSKDAERRQDEAGVNDDDVDGPPSIQLLSAIVRTERKSWAKKGEEWVKMTTRASRTDGRGVLAPKSIWTLCFWNVVTKVDENWSSDLQTLKSSSFCSSLVRRGEHS